MPGRAVKFTITPLGGGRRDVAKVVDAIVRYLQPTPAGPPTVGDGALEGPSRYYADSGEEPGRWLGAAARRSGLTGAVGRTDFASVLAGRDPRTGERLITAQGSAGRRPRLGAGNHTMTSPDGERYYDETDAAAALGVTRAEVVRMLDVGARQPSARTPVTPPSLPALVPGPLPASVPTGAPRPLPAPLPAGALPTSVPGPLPTGPSGPLLAPAPGALPARVPTENSGPVPAPVSTPVPVGVSGVDVVDPEGSFLTPIVDANGGRWVTENELSRCVDAREAGTSSEVISAAGSPDDQFPLAEAARLAGVTQRYMRKVAKHWEDHGVDIGAAVAAGRAPRRAWLVAHRGTRGRWVVTRRELAAFLDRRRPPAVRVGFDVTLTTEKSLGVLALVGGPDTAAAVLGAVQDGNDWAMGWLEGRAATARVGGDTVAAEGWTVASFRHLTSRALDPFPHHHNVVANTVTLGDGTRRALDARGLYRHTHAASALATAEMRHHLSRRLGVRWRPGRKGGWEIAGINDAVLNEFSKRRGEIDDALRELEDAIGRGAHPGEVEHIVLRTRPAKSHTPVADLVDDWRRRAVRHGFDTAAVAACHGHDVAVALDEPDVDALFADLAGPEGICRDGSVFTRADAVVALANHPVPGHSGSQPLLCGAARLETLAGKFLISPHVVVLDSDGGEDMFTTVEMLRVQNRIVSRFAAGRHQSAALVSPGRLTDTFDRHRHLTGEQRDLVAGWCTSGHRFQAAIGRAGAGKTTTVAATATAWQANGYRVLGAAVKGEAARTLAAATGVECETVAWYLAHDDPLNSPFDTRTVLVVDEASTLSDRDLDQLMWMTATAGATMRLVGDPAQHGAVAAGGMFRVLCQRHAGDTPELVTTHRVQDPDDCAAADALRDGRVDDALDHLQRAGHLHVVDDDLAMYRHVLARWWDAHRQGHHHPMVDQRNSTRRQLNRLAHHLLQASGEIGVDEIVASGDRRFSIGDRITARTPNRALHPDGQPQAYVRNGALGTITSTAHGAQPADDILAVDFDGLGTIEVPRGFFDHHPSRGGRTEVGIDHAYALTSYAVQGSTHDLSTSRIDATATRAETYVDITRGRLANHLYLTNTTDPLDGEALPQLPAPPADHTVAERLRRSTSELTAWELAHAAEAAHHGPGIG